MSLAADPAFDALDDPQVLELASNQGRILVTRNSRDFAPLLREWSEGNRHHCGCILIWTLAHNESGAIISGVTRLLGEYRDPEQWRDLAVALVTNPIDIDTQDHPRPGGQGRSGSGAR